MLKAERIDYFVNDAHKCSGLPPVKTEEHMDIFPLVADDLLELRDKVDGRERAFRKIYGLPEAIAVMKVAN